MAAETACAAGATVDLYERMGSVGRKFLIAGKGGLNLTHSDPPGLFATRYGARQPEIHRWLAAFDADALREWARGLGVETFVGSSGRVFPRDLKAAPLLRGWVRRLRASGVRFHVHHEWRGWDEEGALRFGDAVGEARVHAQAVVLALGGGSWPVLGSDGGWAPLLERRGIGVAPLMPSNCGFDVAWSAHFSARHAGQPVKPVAASFTDAAGHTERQQGEFVLTDTGVEGSLVYAFSARLRDAIAAQGQASWTLDLLPQHDAGQVLAEVARPRGPRSLSTHLKSRLGIQGVKMALLHEVLTPGQLHDPKQLAQALKALPIPLVRPRPVAEAISTAGGVPFEALDANAMLRALPGVFCAGEMLDWEAPTGGYLLTACLATGRWAGQGVLHWLAGSRGPGGG